MQTQKDYATLLTDLLVMEHNQTPATAAALVKKHTHIVTRGIMHGGVSFSGLRVTALAILDAERLTPSPATEGKYGEITASLKQFHPGEPVFLLRATDPDAPAAVRDYGGRCVKRGCDSAHTNAVFAHAAAIDAWQKANPHLVKARAD